MDAVVVGGTSPSRRRHVEPARRPRRPPRACSAMACSVGIASGVVYSGGARERPTCPWATCALIVISSRATHSYERQSSSLPTSLRQHQGEVKGDHAITREGDSRRLRETQGDSGRFREITQMVSNGRGDFSRPWPHRVSRGRGFEQQRPKLRTATAEAHARFRPPRASSSRGGLEQRLEPRGVVVSPEQMEGGHLFKGLLPQRHAHERAEAVTNPLGESAMAAEDDALGG